MSQNKRAIKIERRLNLVSKFNRTLLMKSTILSMCLLILSCQHEQKRTFNKVLDEGSCEEALVQVPETSSTFKVVDVSKQATGTLISYSLTGVSYIAQVVVDLTFGLASKIVLCTPDMITALSANGTPNADLSQKLCLSRGQTNLVSDDRNRDSRQPAALAPIKQKVEPSGLDLIPKSNIAGKVYEGTKSFRCPDVSSLGQSIRRVAQCYAKRGGEANFQKATKTLESISNSQHFYECLPQSEIELFTKELAQYRHLGGKDE